MFMRTSRAEDSWGNEWMPVSGPAGSAALTLLDLYDGERLVVQATEYRVEYRRTLPAGAVNVAVEIDFDSTTGAPVRIDNLDA